MTVADDKSFGEFMCELIDSTATFWKRAIQLEVIGKFKTGKYGKDIINLGVADYRKGVPKLLYSVIQFFSLGQV